MTDDNKMKEPHEHASEAGAPGASGPGDPGYEGDVTIGEEGASGGDDTAETPAEAESDATEGEAPTG
jgi:hypothetical protein